MTKAAIDKIINTIDRSGITGPTPSTTRARKKVIPQETLAESFKAKPEKKASVSLLNQPLAKGSPYTLESGNLIIEMERLKENADSEIIAIQAEQKSIHDQAQRDMEVIASRAKAEIDARTTRINDLQRSIILMTHGLNNDPGVLPPEQVSVQSDPPSEDENEQ